MGRGRSPGCPRAVDVSRGLLVPVSEPQFTSLFERLQVLEGKVLSLEPIYLRSICPLSQPPLPLQLCLSTLELSSGSCLVSSGVCWGWTPPRSASLGRGSRRVTACVSKGVPVLCQLEP